MSTSIHRGRVRAAVARLTVATVAVTVLAWTPAAPLHAQDASASAASVASGGATLTGVVLDSISGDPIEGVMVRVDSGDEMLTDRRGRFRFTDLPEGKRLLAMLTADCRVTWGEVTVLQRFDREVEFRLPQAFGASAEEQRRQEEERKRTGGKRLEAHEIDALNATSALELIRRLAPNMVHGLSGEVGSDPTLQSGRNSSIKGGAAPVVTIDGVRTPSPELALSQLRPSEVQLIEVLPGAAAGWEYGSSGAAGVIKVTLRRGLARGAVSRREAAPCVVPAFPGG